MENKGKKMLALIAVIGLCAVALIGAGYAAFGSGITARTYNSDNNVDAGSIVIAPNGDNTTPAWQAITGANANKQEFKTYSYGTGNNTSTAYYLTGAASIGSITVGQTTTNYVGISLGSKTFTISNQTSADITKVTLSVEQSKLVGNADFKYFVKVGNVLQELQNSGEITALNFTDIVVDIDAYDGTTVSTDTVTVNLYIGYAEDVYIPDVGYGPAVDYEHKGNDHSQGAKESSLFPVSVSDLALKIGLQDTTEPAPANP